MAPLFHKAAIRNYRMKILWSALLHRATIIRYTMLHVYIHFRYKKSNYKFKHQVPLYQPAY